MKSIKETHPSLIQDWDELLNWDSSHRGYDKELIVKQIQKHTVDKAVLKEILKKDRPTPFRGDQASSEVYGGIVEDIYQLLEG